MPLANQGLLSTSQNNQIETEGRTVLLRYKSKGDRSSILLLPAPSQALSTIYNLSSQAAQSIVDRISLGGFLSQSRT